ncbi:hypothetical protein HPB50_007591 [Hyalomma asiaticum]|uniref:Uncharacterized protein n=1 Tax=Hyalomma asiaticum TaxID=266040 RepID=A0ACB7TE01_HYAAI|nr:hypothetical protein HPB50_007591 [Hyalomma asiaticum]
MISCRRYQTIHKHLLLGAVVASSLTNMLASSHSSTLRNVIGYIESRYHQPVMTNAIWWTVLLPAQLSGIVVFWLHLKFPEFLPATILLTWILANSLTMLDWRKTFDFVEYPEHLDFDYVTAVLAFALPWATLHRSWSTDFRSIARRLPWGAFFLYFGSLHLGFAEFGMGEWIARRVRSITAPNLTLTQMVLTSCSVFLTEMMGNVETISMLMPIVVDVAIGHKCHPMYFAVPVLVGASTSVVFPMGSMALALANSIADTGAKDTMAAGLLIKTASISMTLLVVNTVGFHLFSWSEVPPWLHAVTTAATSTNQTYEIDLLPL